MYAADILSFMNAEGLLDRAFIFDAQVLADASSLATGKTIPFSGF
jgi:hypothetical protein